MNYKTIMYNCGCKYIFITDPEKQILKAHKFCPIHPKILKKHVELWCVDCNIKLTETGLLAWQRKMRCLDCAKADQKKRTKENWRKKAEKYNIKRRKKAKKINFFAMEKTGALRLLYRKMSIKLPVVETPVLDKYKEDKLCFG